MIRDLPQPQQDPAEVREITDEILERSEYNPSETLAELVLRKIGEFFDWLFGGSDSAGSTGGGGGGGTLGWLAWIVLVLLVAGVVGFVGWAIATGRLRGPGRRRRRRKGRDDDGVVVGHDDDLPPQQWLEAAQAHETAGRWRQGIQCRYRALVVELASHDLVSEVAGRTSGELRREVEATAHIPAGSELRSRYVDGFSQATDQFEEVWYGGAESGPAERDRFMGLAENVLGAVGEVAARGRGRSGQLEVAS